MSKPRPRVVAWDTWAFVEMALELPRHEEIEHLLRSDLAIVTSREVVVETAKFLIKRTGKTEPALAWWQALGDSSVRVIEHPMEELFVFAEEVAPGTALSLADLSLAQAAHAVGATEIATEDGGFRALELEPLFAR